MLSEDKFTEVEEKQANTSVKQVEQDRRRRQIYGRGEIFRKSRQKAQTYFCTSPLKFTIFIVSFARKMI